MLATALLQFAAAAVVVIVAGGFLARACDEIADLTGFGRLLVGSVLLAGATSLPELGVDVSAVLAGHDDIAVGDLMGSSLFNLLILAIADLMHRQRGWMLSRAASAHALSGSMSVLLTAVASLMILSRLGVAVAGVGLGSVVVLLVYILGVRIVSFDQRLVRAQAAAEAEAGSMLPVPDRRRRLVLAGLRFALAAGAVVAAAPFVAHAAGTIAEASGLGGTFVGTTLVAASTSLPELVATIASVRMGAFDLAAGNIFGSNAFNMAMLVVVDGFSTGPLLSTVSTTHAITGLWVVVVSVVAILGQLYHAERRRRVIEPDAFLIILLVALALFSLYRAEQGAP
ncbi:MAG: inner membrane protein YrbG [Planctomycetota bacterium]